MPPPKIAPHFRVSRATSDPSKGERSGNKNILRSYPTPSESSVWEVSAITMTATEWGIHGERKSSLSPVRRQAASIADLAWSFLSCATILQMSESFDAVLMLDNRRRIRRSAPHHSVRVTSCLVGADGQAGACIWKGCCSGICWIRGFGVGGWGGRGFS